MKRKLLSILLCLAMALSLLPTAALAEEAEGAGTIKVGNASYESFSEAVDAATPDENGVITYEISGKVDVSVTTSNSWGMFSLLKDDRASNKSVKTIKLVKGSENAEICIKDDKTIIGLSNARVDVVYEGLKLSRTAGKYSDDAAHGTCYFTTWLRAGGKLTYINCTFPNGTYNNQYGTTEYTQCEFSNQNESAAKNAGVGDYNLWTSSNGAGGNGVVKVSNCTFEGVRGVKLYSTNGTAGSLELSETTFTNLTEKAAIVVSTPATVEMNAVTATGCSNGLLQKKLDNQSAGVAEIVIPSGSNVSGAFDLKAEDNVAGTEFNITAGTFPGGINNDYLAPGANFDATTGEVKMSYVAKIGDTEYPTLAAAVDAAKDGDTIKLLKDVTDGDGVIVPSGKNFTLDFDKHTYTVTKNLAGSKGTESQCFQLLKNSTLTFKNGTIRANNGNVAMIIQNYSNLTLENMLLDGTSITRNGATYTMSNNHGDVVIDDTTINAGGAYPRVAFDVCGYDTYTGVSVTVKGSSVIEGDIEISRSSNNAKDVKLALESGTVTGKLKIDGSIQPGDATAITKTENVSLPAPSGYTWTKVGNTGVLVKDDSAAVVNGVGYTTLAAAINAAGNDDTVTLLKDAELTSTLNLAKNITIDGQGKYTIKAANSFTVGSDNKTYCVLYVSGEVTLKDVTVNGNEKCRVIFCDKGKLTIDGATITNGKAPNFIGGVYMTSSASFEMKSGSITGNKNAEQYQNDKYVQYSSDLWIGANANGALTAINGGTIGNVFVNANAWSASNPGSFTMNGGTVTNLYVEHDANYGATFKYNDGTIEHLYLSKENGNGQSIEVTPVKGVIYNGGVKEEDLVTLTLKYNDGATADSTYNVASGTTITLPAPTRSGYTFNGWYDGSTKVNSSYKVTKDVTLTASWSYISSGSSSSDPTYSVSTPSKTKNGTVTVSPKNASKGDTVTVTVKPDSGYVLETLTVTDKNGNELTLKDKGNGKYTFTMPAGKVEVKATFMEDNSMLNFFYDVPNNAYFYEAVKWAVENGITTGVGNDLFAPEQPCTRAQIVTFLWRAAGSPEPKGAASGMTDVVSGSYYEKAVAWAIENGITTGTTTSTFSPDVTCTRAQAVTFLARALKAKAASAAEFSDVPTDSYFAEAVAWAAANGVTEGIGGGLFGPDNDCTRGQIVTFLYRAYNK